MSDPTWTRWLSRYGSDYETDAERRVAFELYRRNREEVRRVFEDETE